jgi:hypothetical protein
MADTRRTTDGTNMIFQLHVDSALKNLLWSKSEQTHINFEVA